MSPEPLSHESLLADAEALDQFRVAVRVLALQIIQEAAALADQLQQAAARVVVLGVRLEMFGQIADPSGGRHPVSPWGQPEGRTRDKNKPSSRMIIRRRKTGKKR